MPETEQPTITRKQFLRGVGLGTAALIAERAASSLQSKKGDEAVRREVQVALNPELYDAEGWLQEPTHEGFAMIEPVDRHRFERIQGALNDATPHILIGGSEPWRITLVTDAKENEYFQYEMVRHEPHSNPNQSPMVQSPPDRLIHGAEDRFPARAVESKGFFGDDITLNTNANEGPNAFHATLAHAINKIRQPGEWSAATHFLIFAPRNPDFDPNKKGVLNEAPLKVPRDKVNNQVTFAIATVAPTHTQEWVNSPGHKTLSSLGEYLSEEVPTTRFYKATYCS